MNIKTDLLTEQRVSNDAKSIGVAYLFMILFGVTGAYLFYLGRWKTGILMLVNTIMGITILFGSQPIPGVWAAPSVGFLMIMVSSFWWIIDLFFVPGFIQAHKNELRKQYMSEMD